MSGFFVSLCALETFRKGRGELKEHARGGEKKHHRAGEKSLSESGCCLARSYDDLNLCTD